MGLNNLSLKQKVLFAVGGSAAVLLLLASSFLVNHIANLTRGSVEAEVNSLMHSEKLKIESFFGQYGRVAKTFLENPYFVNWFENHQQRGAEHTSIEGYNYITQTFVNVSESDANILSAFFATQSTGEYFRENEVIGVPTEGAEAGDVTKGYFVNTRSWYKEALEHDGFFVSSPTADSNTGIVSAVVQTPIYNSNKELIGVGGVDILLANIGKMVDAITYNNEGFAFLVDDEAKLVHFSQKSGRKIEHSTELAKFDANIPNTEGFAQLAQQMKRNKKGFETITFNGSEYYVSYTNASNDIPKYSWTVGILVPTHVIEEPISDAVITSSLAVVAILAVLTVFIWITISKLIAPLNSVGRALKEIASGDGDLTKTIEIKQRDEVGVVAGHFNRFTKTLRELLRQTTQQAQLVSDASSHLSKVSRETNSEIQQEKIQVENVTSAITEMAGTVLEISRNASATSNAADDAEKQTSLGHTLSTEAMNEMNALSDNMEEAVNVVSNLSDESNNIGAVVDVINSIAEQTNLLALNAAIEAARAGESGRGFAVVADEVRTLASRTTDSTNDIRNMVERLQSISNSAKSVMTSGQQQTQQGVQKTKQVREALDAISDAITRVQDQSHQIAVATEEQSVVAENVNESMQSITDLVDNTAVHAGELADDAQQLSDTSTELNNIVNQFKI